MLEARSGAVAFGAGARLIVCGGTEPPESSCEAYDTRAGLDGEWVSYAPLQRVVYQGAGASDGRRLYAISGIVSGPAETIDAGPFEVLGSALLPLVVR
jgi:hypothetical protein